MNDQEAYDFLQKALDTPTLPSLNQNGKVRILGYALRKMLVYGPPKYFIGYVPKMAIYDFGYKESELLELCQALCKKKRVTEPKDEIGIGRINGQSLFDACIEGGLTAGKIEPQKFFEARYHE